LIRDIGYNSIIADLDFDLLVAERARIEFERLQFTIKPEYHQP